MWKYSRIVRSTLAVTLVISMMVGCKPDATPQAKEGEKWLTDFYKRTPIRNGDWLFFGASADDNNVMIVFNIPSQQGHDITAFNEQEKIYLISRTACPALSEAIWAVIGDGDVIIDVRSNGSMIAKVSCKTKELRSK